jgi:hypothetical protein
MTALAGGNAAPSFRFGAIGSSVTGTVIDFTDIPVTDFATKVVKNWPGSDQPIMQTRVTLEQPNGERVSVYVKGKMLVAVRAAIKAVGSEDIEELATLTVTRSGQEPSKNGGQPAWLYTAAYVPFDPTA